MTNSTMVQMLTTSVRPLIELLLAEQGGKEALLDTLNEFAVTPEAPVLAALDAGAAALAVAEPADAVPAADLPEVLNCITRRKGLVGECRIHVATEETTIAAGALVSGYEAQSESNQASWKYLEEQGILIPADDNMFTLAKPVVCINSAVALCLIFGGNAGGLTWFDEDDRPVSRDIFPSTRREFPSTGFKVKILRSA